MTGPRLGTEQYMDRQAGPGKGLRVEVARLGCTGAFRKAPPSRRSSCQGEGLGFIPKSRDRGQVSHWGLGVHGPGYLA